MNNEEEKYGAPKKTNCVGGRGCASNKKNQDFGMETYIQEIISKANAKSSTRVKVIKRKEPINISLERLIYLHTSKFGNSIQFEEPSEISPRISSPYVIVAVDDKIIKEGFGYIELIDQGLIVEEQLFSHHTLDCGSVMKQVIDIKNNNDLLESLEPSKQRKVVEQPKKPPSLEQGQSTLVGKPYGTISLKFQQNPMVGSSITAF